MLQLSVRLYYLWVFGTDILKDVKLSSEVQAFYLHILMLNWVFSQGGKDPHKMSLAWWFEVYILYLYISLYQYSIQYHFI